MIRRLQPTLQYTRNHVKRGIQNFAHPIFKDEQSFNDCICSLCKQKHLQNVVRAFDVLENNSDYLVYPGTYAHLLSACSSLRALQFGKRVHDHILKSKLQPDMILENHILNMYGKCGSQTDARKVFDSMRERNVVTWTALIAGYSQNSSEIEAVDLYIQMHRSSFKPDQFTFGSVIKACSGLADADLGRQLHAQVVKSEFGSHLIAQNALIAMYTKFGQINETCNVFSCITSKDLISWSSMISGFSKLGYELESVYCFKEMLSQGTYHPNEFIFGSVFSACASLGEPEYGKQIHGVSLKYGLGGDAFTGCSLSDMYAKCGFLCSAKTAFDLIENPDRVSWNALIGGFAYGGNTNGAMVIFSQMRHFEFTPDDITVRSLLCAFMDPLTLSQGKQVHSYIIKMGLDLDVPVCNTLLTMYANSSNFSDAYKLFNENRGNADLVSWNAITTMCMQSHQFEEVFSLFRTMLISQGAPDHITIANVLGACGRFSSLEMGDQIYCYSMKAGLDLHTFVMNASVDMYVKCGSLERARELFELTENPDIFSWSSLIVGYAQFGHGEEALNLFKTMKSQCIKPNQVTFVGVLTACSHIGLVEEGLHLFKSMEKEHGVVPTREHYSCVVDLLARAGRIYDAEAFINQMDFEPDIVIWKTLLAACKTRNNIDVGKRVAENILKIDPSSSAAHVLLCGLYACAGGWKDVAALRGLMREKGVKKVPGQSWIEVDNKINFFSAEDGLHPEREKIYSILEELWLQILDAGYTPSWE